MNETTNPTEKSFGSPSLDGIIQRLKSTSDPKRKYEYVLWLAKKLPVLSEEELSESIKVKGCVSQVYVLGELKEGIIKWKGYSDALITKGLLSLLIQGLNNLSPKEVINIDNDFILETGLNTSLTPSRANGFLNILLNMKKQAISLSQNPSSLLNKI
ncbi:SufE family protein [Prochlorococcus sp. MIT 1223]|uniref:SufE family protein n=1 Tax=Prochlorococcus sp. MIT 1223 TaxID=3096217 RepID=UPI002A756517|nr:SufE family protein [Prochlorococcus sp. MIT 1223]